MKETIIILLSRQTLAHRTSGDDGNVHMSAAQRRSHSSHVAVQLFKGGWSVQELNLKFYFI